METSRRGQACFFLGCYEWYAKHVDHAWDGLKETMDPRVLAGWLVCLVFLVEKILNWVVVSNIF